MNEGWLCPKCGSAHAPSVLTCPNGQLSLTLFNEVCECGLRFWQTCSRNPCKLRAPMSDSNILRKIEETNRII